MMFKKNHKVKIALERTQDLFDPPLQGWYHGKVEKFCLNSMPMMPSIGNVRKAEAYCACPTRYS